MARSAKPIPTYKRRRRGKRSFVGWLVRLVLMLFLFSIILVAIYRFVPPPITATMVSDLVSGRDLKKDWMSLDTMDRDMVRAAIAAEDGKFCQHSGFDWDAISDAARRNASGGRIRGGSTISQQTAKNVFLWQGGGYFRKGLEAYFTFLIEHLWGKRRIMEVYLNVAETGIGTYGANAGAQRYFGHDASALSATEAARIAAVLPLPKERGAIAPKGFTRRYGNTIAARLAQVSRDGLDACVYRGSVAPPNQAPPPSNRGTRELPGEEYEAAKASPSEPSKDTDAVDESISTAPDETTAPVPDTQDAIDPALGNDLVSAPQPTADPQR